MFVVIYMAAQETYFSLILEDSTIVVAQPAD